jgi:4-amino-4-deoxy-L-arabinose transferase-like glycosyltransferase
VKNKFGKIKYDWKFALFLLAFAAGIFLRIYHFSDWLYFKLDQARDAFIALQAFEKGPGYLPLLGARAGGTYLLLGPVYYYFQYLALLITRNAYPATYALPDLFFAILSVPMFYIFIKRYFGRNWALYLASVLALCFFAIEYSRFSWNTNPLPFFTLLYFFSLLKSLESEGRKALWWALISGVALSVTSQLHFLAFLGFPVVTFLLIIIDRKNLRGKTGWRIILVFLSGFLILYVPWILSDLGNNWKNTLHFWDAVLTKLFSATLWQDVVLGFAYFAQDWIIILTGYVATMKEHLLFLLAWIVFILPSIFLNWKFYRSEQDAKKRRFLLLTLLWFLIFLIVYIPIGHQLRARYFLVMEALPLIYLGYILKYINSLRRRGKNVAVAAVAAAVIIGNLAGTYLWFNQLALAEKQTSVDSKRTFVFKEEDDVTLWHIDQAAKYITDNCTGKEVRFAAPPVHLKAVDYMLRYYAAKKTAEQKSKSGEYCFYAVGSSKSDMGYVDANVKNNFHVAERKIFGLVGVYKIEPNDPKNISFKRLYDINSDEITEETKANRIYWKDLFSPGKN